MSIPIKAQGQIDNGEFVNIVLLKDGSVYGIDYSGVMIELSRSYTGGVIRKAMKDKLTEYHEDMRLANLARKSRDFLSADDYAKDAVDKKAEYLVIAKLFDGFKEYRSDFDDHDERFARWEESQKKKKKAEPRSVFKLFKKVPLENPTFFRKECD